MKKRGFDLGKKYYKEESARSYEYTIKNRWDISMPASCCSRNIVKMWHHQTKLYGGLSLCEAS